MDKNDYLPWAYLDGKIRPFKDANVSIATSGLQYGLACFGGIRGYRQPDGSIAILRLDEHVARLLRSAKILRLDIKLAAPQLKKIILDLAKKNQPKDDIYIRPLVFKSDLVLPPSLKGEFDLAIYMRLTGNYLPTDRGLDVCVSSWVRPPDNVIPSRAKASGAYINSALASKEATDNGYDNAIMLDANGCVAEGTSMNIFLVRAGQLVTPALGGPLLEGITRRSLIEIAKAEGIEVVERSVARSELYIADEAFFCGTATQVAWIKQIDKRLITPKIGPLTKLFKDKFERLVRGQEPDYQNWLTPAS